MTIENDKTAKAQNNVYYDHDGGHHVDLFVLVDVMFGDLEPMRLGRQALAALRNANPQDPVLFVVHDHALEDAVQEPWVETLVCREALLQGLGRLLASRPGI